MDFYFGVGQTASMTLIFVLFLMLFTALPNVFKRFRPMITQRYIFGSCVTLLLAVSIISNNGTGPTWLAASIAGLYMLYDYRRAIGADKSGWVRVLAIISAIIIAFGFASLESGVDSQRSVAASVAFIWSARYAVKWVWAGFRKA